MPKSFFLILRIMNHDPNSRSTVVVNQFVSILWGFLCAETCFVAQAGCNLWNSNDMPASASQRAGATYACHCGWQYLERQPSHNCKKMLPVVLVVVSPHWICVEVSFSRGWGNRLWRNPKRTGRQKLIENRPVSEHSDGMYFAEWGRRIPRH